MSIAHQGIFSLVIVTYKRNSLLRKLLYSAAEAALPTDSLLILVDNDGGAREIIDEFPDLKINYIAPERNIGGSGGFFLGAKRALELGADWVWLMDDDVVFLPNAYYRIAPYLSKFPAMIGERLNPDGKRFYFRARFNNWLAVPLPPLSKKSSKDSDFFLTDVLSFEGALISRPVFDKIGLPDSRFFITWDDAVFGWLAAKHFPVAVVNAEVLQRTKDLAIGNFFVRPLQGSSDLSRYYVMRNRSLVAEYFQLHGQYSFIGFSIGTALVFCKELARLLLVERKLSGIGALWRGLKHGW